MQKLIDTNIIPRYLLNHHPQMSQQAKTIIEAGAFTLPEAIAEAVRNRQGLIK